MQNNISSTSARPGLISTNNAQNRKIGLQSNSAEPVDFMQLLQMLTTGNGDLPMASGGDQMQQQPSELMLMDPMSMGPMSEDQMSSNLMTIMKLTVTPELIPNLELPNIDEQNLSLVTYEVGDLKGHWAEIPEQLQKMLLSFLGNSQLFGNSQLHSAAVNPIDSDLMGNQPQASNTFGMTAFPLFRGTGNHQLPQEVMLQHINPNTRESMQLLINQMTEQLLSQEKSANTVTPLKQTGEQTRAVPGLDFNLTGQNMAANHAVATDKIIAANQVINNSQVQSIPLMSTATGKAVTVSKEVDTSGKVSNFNLEQLPGTGQKELQETLFPKITFRGTVESQALNPGNDKASQMAMVNNQGVVGVGSGEQITEHVELAQITHAKDLLINTGKSMPEGMSYILRTGEGNFANHLAGLLRGHMAKDGNGQTNVRLQLHPKHLGEVVVKLVYKDGSITTHFHAATEQAKQLIESSLPQLREALANFQLNLQNASVSVGGEGGRWGREGNRERFMPGRQAATENLNETPMEQVSSHEPIRNNGLNYFV